MLVACIQLGKQAAAAQYHSESRLHRTLIILAGCACAYREIFVCEQWVFSNKCVYLCVSV